MLRRVKQIVSVSRSARASFRFSAPLLAITCLALAAGCRNSELADVSGSVTLGGKPVLEGFVSFQPAPDTAGPEFSAKIVSGQFQVAKSVLPGNYAVQIKSWQKTGQMVKSPLGETTDEIVNVIPNRYWGTNSELSAVLTPGVNAVIFDLKN